MMHSYEDMQWNVPPLTSLLYPFVYENYGIRRHHVEEQQMAITESRVPIPTPLPNKITILKTEIN